LLGGIRHSAGMSSKKNSVRSGLGKILEAAYQVAAHASPLLHLRNQLVF
jgi:hypothetical protein